MEKKYGIIKSLPNNKVTVRLRVKTDTWDKLTKIMDRQGINYTIEKLFIQKERAYCTFIFTGTMTQFQTLRIAIHSVQQIRISCKKTMELQLVIYD